MTHRHDTTTTTCTARRGALWTTAALGLLTATGCGGPLGVARSDLEGTWQTPCFEGAQTRLVYADLELSGTYTEFSDADKSCKTPRHVTTWTARATGGEEVAEGVRTLDLEFTSFRSTALTDAEVAFVNQNAYCGLTDWAPGVERDILGLSCYGFAIPVGGKSLDIYRRDEGALLFGKGSKIGADLAESDRPTEIDPNRVFNPL